MDTWRKSNAKFRNDVNEALAQHESWFDQVPHTLQQVLMELQAMHVSNSPHPLLHVVNSFAPRESSNTHSEPYWTQLKLSFPKFEGEDPLGWIFKV